MAIGQPPTPPVDAGNQTGGSYFDPANPASKRPGDMATAPVPNVNTASGQLPPAGQLNTGQIPATGQTGQTSGSLPLASLLPQAGGTSGPAWGNVEHGAFDPHGSQFSLPTGSGQRPAGDFADIAGKLGEAAALTATVQRAVIDHLDAALAECRGNLESVKSTYRGHCDCCCDEPAVTLAKCQAKVVDHCQGQLFLVYGLLAPYGIGHCPLEDVFSRAVAAGRVPEDVMAAFAPAMPPSEALEPANESQNPPIEGVRFQRPRPAPEDVNDEIAKADAEERPEGMPGQPVGALAGPQEAAPIPNVDIRGMPPGPAVVQPFVVAEKIGDVLRNQANPVDLRNAVVQLALSVGVQVTDNGQGGAQGGPGRPVGFVEPDRRGENPPIPPVAGAAFGRGAVPPGPAPDVGIGWCSQTICADVAKWEKAQNNPDLAGFAGFFGIGGADPMNLNVDPNRPLGKVLIPLAGKGFWAGAVAKTLAIGVWMISQVADSVMKMMQLPANCNKNAVQSLLVNKMIKGAVNKYVGVDVDLPGSNTQYTLNWLCPSLIESTGDALAAYYASVITLEDYRCFTRANGQCPRAAETIRLTNQQRTGQSDLAELRRRGLLPELEYRERMRMLGWIDGSYIDDQWILTDWKPELSTVGTWMKRGIYSADVAHKELTDTNFDKRFTQEVKDAYFRVGVDEDAARLLWRDHWQELDVQTAYQMYQRFRPGSVDKGREFTEDDLLDVLERNGINPRFWWQYQKLANPPIGFRQLGALYDRKLLTPKQLKSMIADNGFGPDEAAVLATKIIMDQPGNFRSMIGGTGAGALMKRYAAAEIGDDEYTVEMQVLGFTSEEILAALAEGRLERRRDSRSKVIGFMKRKFLGGELNALQSRTILSKWGLDVSASSELLREWTQERDMQPKQIGAAELLTWRKDGLISQDEFASRMALLNYSAVDIARIVDESEWKETQKRIADAEKSVASVAGNARKATAGYAKFLALAGKAASQAERDSRSPIGSLINEIGKSVSLIAGKATGKSSRKDQELALERLLGEVAPAPPKEPKSGATNGTGTEPQAEASPEESMALGPNARDAVASFDATASEAAGELGSDNTEETLGSDTAASDSADQGLGN